MASNRMATQEPPRPFYCHQCSHQWMKSHNSLFECPRCREGFIEEVSEDFNPNIPIPFPPQSPLGFILYDAFSSNEDQRSRHRARRNRDDNNHQPSTSRSRSPHISDIVIGTNNGNRETNRGVRVFMRHNASRFLSVSIDDIMNTLFTSERHPAMTQEQLNEIPLATITSEQVEAQLQCAICFEDFQVNENEIRKLLCNHFFHEKCIFPWLRNNASCPVCRTSLAGANNDSDEEVSTFIQFLTQNRRAQVNQTNRDANQNNEPGPSSRVHRHLQSAAEHIARNGAARRQRSQRDNQANPVIPEPSRATRSLRNNQTNSNAGEPSNLRQRVINRETNGRVNSPISSRTRSHPRANGNPPPPSRLPVLRRTLRSRQILRDSVSPINGSNPNIRRQRPAAQPDNNNSQQQPQRSAPQRNQQPSENGGPSAQLMDFYNRLINDRTDYWVARDTDDSSESSSLNSSFGSEGIIEPSVLIPSSDDSPPPIPRVVRSPIRSRIFRPRVDISDDSD